MKPWYARSEALYYKAHAGSVAGLEAYLRALPAGPHGVALIQGLLTRDHELVAWLQAVQDLSLLAVRDAKLQLTHLRLAVLVFSLGGPRRFAACRQGTALHVSPR